MRLRNRNTEFKKSIFLLRIQISTISRIRIRSKVVRIRELLLELASAEFPRIFCIDSAHGVNKSINLLNQGPRPVRLIER